MPAIEVEKHDHPGLPEQLKPAIEEKSDAPSDGTRLPTDEISAFKEPPVTETPVVDEASSNIDEVNEVCMISSVGPYLVNPGY